MTTAAQVFTFGPTTASFVRMVSISNNGGAQVGFGEAAFAVQAAARRRRLGAANLRNSDR